jgi:hypothetical protein
LYYAKRSVSTITHVKEKDMNQLLKTKEELQKAFEDAKQGMNPEAINKVMKGLPFKDDNAPDARALRAAWSQYRVRL